MSDEAPLATGLENHLEVETEFSECIGILTSMIEDEHINKLANIADELLLVRYCHLSMLVPVPELTFSVTVGSDTTTPMVMVPFDWLSKIQRSVRDETGRVLRVCSQLVDYYNDRYLDQVEESRDRADMFEAQLYLKGGWKGSRSKDLLKKYPHGKHSEAARHLLYSPKPFFSLME